MDLNLAILLATVAFLGLAAYWLAKKSAATAREQERLRNENASMKGENANLRAKARIEDEMRKVRD